jgi:hypothetical protein
MTLFPKIKLTNLLIYLPQICLSMHKKYEDLLSCMQNQHVEEFLIFIQQNQRKSRLLLSK